MKVIPRVFPYYAPTKSTLPYLQYLWVSTKDEDHLKRYQFSSVFHQQQSSNLINRNGEKLFLEYQNNTNIRNEKEEENENEIKNDLKFKEIEEEEEDPIYIQLKMCYSQEELAEFICPISGTFITDPVIAPDGFTYDRVPLTKWLYEDGTSPITRIRMTMDDTKPNEDMSIRFEDLKRKMGEKNAKEQIEKEEKQKQLQKTTTLGWYLRHLLTQSKYIMVAGALGVGVISFGVYYLAANSRSISSLSRNAAKTFTTFSSPSSSTSYYPFGSLFAKQK